MKKICPVCGREFETYAGNKKYCSAECSIVGYVIVRRRIEAARCRNKERKLVHSTCIQCGKKFWGKSVAKFCSAKCEIEYRLNKCKETGYAPDKSLRDERSKRREIILRVLEKFIDRHTLFTDVKLQVLARQIDDALEYGK